MTEGPNVAGPAGQLSCTNAAAAQPSECDAGATGAMPVLGMMCARLSTRALGRILTMPLVISRCWRGFQDGRWGPSLPPATIAAGEVCPARALCLGCSVPCQPPAHLYNLAQPVLKTAATILPRHDSGEGLSRTAAAAPGARPASS